ncbi:STAS/SEC14 domain-containing protein [Marinoscillum pacificum]|uniref:STAS/SEC14 domain-containing protein n=1 Tax=Marinoscillum pacificum TaxID=392723 RepID=UPI0021584685|nr:STAS/SEC14 domain-containing protein [Marinoscillum pacificum]
MNNKNISIYRYMLSGEQTLRFDFKGKFDLATCTEAVNIWQNEFDRLNGGKISIIWDCSQMSGFDIEAQREWVKWMKGLSDQIEKVIVVADNIVIRGAARLILKLFHFKSEVYSSISAISNELAGVYT